MRDIGVKSPTDPNLLLTSLDIQVCYPDSIRDLVFMSYLWVSMGITYIYPQKREQRIANGSDFLIWPRDCIFLKWSSGRSFRVMIPVNRQISSTVTVAACFQLAFSKHVWKTCVHVLLMISAKKNGVKNPKMTWNSTTYRNIFLFISPKRTCLGPCL